LEEGIQIGPIVSETQFNKVKQYIKVGIDEGAKVVIGGSQFDKNTKLTFEKGFYVPPTIFTNVNSNMKIWKEEIFGPVLVCVPFSNEKEAISIANDTQFGLAGSVFTEDKEKFKRMRNSIKVGTLWLNTSQPCFNSVPFGGMKKSGIGRELGGINALKNYLDIKSVISNDVNMQTDFFI